MRDHARQFLLAPERGLRAYVRKFPSATCHGQLASCVLIRGTAAFLGAEASTDTRRYAGRVDKWRRNFPLELAAYAKYTCFGDDTAVAFI